MKSVLSRKCLFFDTVMTIALQKHSKLENPRKSAGGGRSGPYTQKLGLMPRALWWATMFVCLGGGLRASAQSAATLGAVKRIYVEPLGGKPGAEELRADLIAELRKSHRVTVLASLQEADAVIGGTGETWIRGYYSLNPRARSVGSDAHPIYGGYLSVELKGAGGETLWSYLVTPRRFAPEDIGRNLCGQIVRKLVEVLK
jgi:hypothetical protein